MLCVIYGGNIFFLFQFVICGWVFLFFGAL